MFLHEAIDAATVTARICADGALVADVKAARTGIQDYLGSEIDPQNGHGLRDKTTVKVYRPESEVFKADSLASFAAAPLTIDHPSQPVTADNWKQLGRGEVHGDVVRDGGFVRVPIIVRDADAVKAVTTTHKQLSMGYACKLVFPTDGKHPDGTACDAWQSDIKINHIAAVRAARGGPELKISDERPPQHKETAMKIKIGDAEVDATNGEAVRIAVDALNKNLSDSATQIATLTADSATKDAKIATLEKAVEDAKLTPAALRDAAKQFAAVCDKAKALGVTFDDSADADAIMKAAVTAKMGDTAKDWTADQIAASFAVLTADTKVDPLRAAISDGVKSVSDAATVEKQAYADSVTNLNAWRNPAKASA